MVELKKTQNNILILVWLYNSSKGKTPTLQSKNDLKCFK